MPLLFANSEQDMEAWSQSNQNPSAGGYVSFLGHVREINQQKKVSFLFYEAYVDLAKQMFFALEQEAKTRFGIVECLAVHRVGRTNVGEKAVAIMVAAPHRHEAFLAARFLIDELKKTLPIWKKEAYEDGSSTWDKGACSCSLGVDNTDVLVPVHQAFAAKKIPRDAVQTKRVLLVGAGGLGCPVALNMAALGVKELHIYDGDAVATSNLARQFMFKLSDVGKNKAALIKRFLGERFLGVDVIAHEEKICVDKARAVISNFDIVIEASDCQHTKKMLAQMVYEQAVPFICASVYQLEGEVQIFSPKAPGCLHCFTSADALPKKSCAVAGVFTHICGVVAGFAASRALSVLAGDHPKNHQLILLEPDENKVTQLAIMQDEHCQVCQIKRPGLLR